MSEHMTGRYYGESSPLFILYIKTALLTLLTLGIYRFWAKTRIRKYIWSATTAGNDSFEYTGTGLEKFLGFLVAIVILAVYLGIVQMILFYFGIFLFEEPQNEAQLIAQTLGFYVTFLAVLPLLLFAQYRARRYKLARSRWRGLRFGMENGAWGYVWRALGHYLITALTLGILLPRQTFYLEKYMTDRTWYGDAKFMQLGRWKDLYPGMKHIFIGAGVLIGGVALGATIDSSFVAGVAVLVGYFWLLIASVKYRIYAFNYLTRNKTLDDEITFVSGAETGTVIQHFVIGMLVTIGVFVVGGLMITLLFSMLGVFAGAPFSGPGMGAGIAVLVLSSVLYLGLILISGAISLVMITQKIIGHIVDTIVVHNAEHLEGVHQRVADSGADAEGFADALDVGGAI